MRLIVIGPKGKMGKLITRVAADNARFTLVAGVGPKGRQYIGRDLGEVAAVGQLLNAPVVDDLESVISDCDVIIGQRQCCPPPRPFLVECGDY